MSMVDMQGATIMTTPCSSLFRRPELAHLGSFA